MSVSFDALVVDLDGVVYRASEPIPGAVEALNEIRGRGVRLLFCTNNAGLTVAAYVDKLQGFGLVVEPEEMLTSPVVLAGVLDADGAAGRTAIVIGSEGLREALTTVGVVIDDDPDTRRADLVAVGLDRDFDYAALDRAAAAARAGAALFATNADTTFPMPGDLAPGAGALLAAVEAASGRKATVTGKPHRPMAEAAARLLDGAKEIAVVGDRPDTDLALAEHMGWTKILVLSGVTASGEAAGVEPAPDVVLASLADLPGSQ